MAFLNFNFFSFHLWCNFFISRLQYCILSICIIISLGFKSFSNCCFQEPFDPMEACQGPRGVITRYQTRFQSGSVVSTENTNIASCTAGRCSHTFEPPSNPLSTYNSVSVAAENVVGMGAATKCTAQPISE